jgi:hypothetical protein
MERKYQKKEANVPRQIYSTEICEAIRSIF